MATAQAAPRGGLSVNAAGAAAALLRSHGRGCTVPIWDILRLPNKHAQMRSPKQPQRRGGGLASMCLQGVRVRVGGGPHHNGVVLFCGVLDGDALDLLIQALHTVAETRSG